MVERESTSWNLLLLKELRAGLSVARLLCKLSRWTSKSAGVPQVTDSRGSEGSEITHHLGNALVISWGYGLPPM